MKPIALAAVGLALVASPARADRRCGYLPPTYPNVTTIRGENVICKKARRVARAVQRDWRRTGGPVTLTRANGQLWECGYRERRGRYGEYIAARCRQYYNHRRVVRMRITI